ncbi:MAG: XdhC family protein [Pseudomonadota bacterium]
MADRGLPRLLAAARARLASDEQAVLATVVDTAGSTYRKAGARMLIAADGSLAGMLGGGCFDTDLAVQARSVLDTGLPRQVEYDMRSPDDAIWGLGLGCEGLVRIFLQRIDRESPLLARLGNLVETGGGPLVTIIAAPDDTVIGTSWRPGEENAPGGVDAVEAATPGVQTRDGATVFVEHVAPAPLLCICGAGADAVPVVDQAAAVGWRVVVLDRRPGHVRPDRFPNAHAVRAFAPDDPDLLEADAVLVMSHSLDGDLGYLRTVAGQAQPWVGVLGPTARRQRLLELLAGDGLDLTHRLRGPVGLDLGGELPEEVGLSIVAELQAATYGRDAAVLTGSGRK